MKRNLDLFFAFIGLALLAPILAAIALAVWLGDRGPVFFAGRRVGREGREFRMLKFRTMSVDAWKSGVNSTSVGDRRITRAGRWLRCAKLDETPQLWNVLKGEMSLVGPRPQVPEEVSAYTDLERRMLSARPGITDLASIVFADEAEILAGCPDPDLMYNQIIRPWKSRLALLYVECASFSADLRILGLTLLAGFSRRRALQGVGTLLLSWTADPLLIRMAARREPLQPWPPPGADRIAARA